MKGPSSGRWRVSESIVLRIRIAFMSILGNQQYTLFNHQNSGGGAGVCQRERGRTKNEKWSMKNAKWGGPGSSLSAPIPAWGVGKGKQRVEARAALRRG